MTSHYSSAQLGGQLLRYALFVTVVQVYAPTTNAKEAEQFYEDLTPKMMSLLS